MTSDLPDWYDEASSVKDSLLGGIKATIRSLEATLIPFVNSSPLKEMSEECRSVSETISRDMQFMKALLAEESCDSSITLREAMAREIRKSWQWRRWRNSIVNLMTMGTAARFDHMEFVKHLFPFSRLHARIVETVFSESSDTPPLKSMLEGEKIGGIIELVPNNDQIVDIFARLIPTVLELWPDIRDRLFSRMSNRLASIQTLFDELESVIQSAQSQAVVQQLLCPQLLPVSAFIAWVSRIYLRRSTGLFVSEVHICREIVPIEERRKLIAFLPELTRKAAHFAQTIFRVPSAKDKMVEASRDLIEKGLTSIFPSEILIQFIDSLLKATGRELNGLAI